MLLATVIGSGIMGETLANGNTAIALMGNTIATGSILYVLITVFWSNFWSTFQSSCHNSYVNIKKKY